MIEKSLSEKFGVYAVELWTFGSQANLDNLLWKLSCHHASMGS